MQLSIDTSTRYASVAVSNGASLVADRSWRAERKHSVELVPEILAIMNGASVTPSELDALYVANGPGGFSALRVGMATAKSMAMSLKVKLEKISVNN